MATKHKFLYPWDYVINLIFKEYGSKDFYKKFKDGGYIFSPEVTKEWRDIYMNWVGICSQDEFFTNIDLWRSKYYKEYPKTTEAYEIIVAHILPIAAPLFHEQV